MWYLCQISGERGDDQVRKECGEVSQWLKEAGHIQARGEKEVSQTWRKRGMKLAPLGLPVDH
jgi:hypothetical protein